LGELLVSFRSHIFRGSSISFFAGQHLAGDLQLGWMRLLSSVQCSVVLVVSFTSSSFVRWLTLHRIILLLSMCDVA
jgi:hypothetical protein